MTDKKFTCNSCGDEIVIDDDASLYIGRDGDGKLRVCRTIPTLCKECRSNRFWQGMRDKLERE